MSKKLLRLFRRKPKIIDYWDCSHLHLTELPREILEHRHTIRSLYMNSNLIRDFPRTLLLFEGLTELDLSENDLLFLPPSISKLPYLKILNLGKNSINNIPDSIGECQDLEVIDFSSNPVSMLCDGMLELRELRVLLLNDTQLEELPPNFGKLSKLETLELRENLLQNLPASLSHLTLLTKLDLGNNEFVSMPTVIGSLESLTDLWFDTNTISIVPEEISNLHNLRFLELSENHIMILPETIGQLVNLTDLYLNDNLLTFLPETLGDLHNLLYLRLDNNRLGGLPETLDGLINVRELNLAHNHLPELPPSLGGMTSLNNLVLDDNILRDFPPEIGNCSSLSLLSFRNNQISELPPELCGLNKLSILNLVGNQLPHLPYSFTTLNNITAIWIAENQSRPILDLQMKIGDDGEKYLTCFLFPQQGHETPYEEATSPLDAVADEDYEDRMLHRKASQVNFDPKVTDRKSNLTRDPTPFPKELHSKAMQWRASREKGETHHGRPGSPARGMDEVALRKPINRRLPNRYSLLKALSDPLIEENLMPASGDVRHHSQSSYYESISPPPPIREQEEQRSSSATPNSGGKVTPTSGGRVTPTTPSNQTAPTDNQTGTPGKTGSAGAELDALHVPLPPFYSPEGSCVQSVQSGPYLDPPAEFSAQTPTSRQAPSPTGLKPHPPVNGGIRHQQIAVVATATTTSEQNGENDRETSPFDIDQPVTITNSNGNNSNPNGRGVLVFCPTTSSPNSRGLQKTDRKFPSRSSILTHSDNAETRSSMESGFDADNELENATAWYLSPEERSPKPENQGPRPKLGPKVAVVSPIRPQNRPQPPPQSGHSSSSTGDHVTHHYQQYSGTASDMQSPGGSQKSRESSISEYDRLHHDRARQQTTAVPLHEAGQWFDGPRRSSLPGEVGNPEDMDPYYSEVYPAHPTNPAHKASQSFDCAEILSDRLHSNGGGPHTVRFMSPPHPPRSGMTKAAIPGHVILFDGHSPTPGAPLSPVTVSTGTSHKQPTRIHGTNALTMKYQQNGMRNHSRSCSQPEELINVGGTPSPLVPHSNSQPYYSHAHQLPPPPLHSSGHTHHHHNHHHRRDRNSSKSGHRRSGEQSVFKSSYPGHYKISHKSHRNSAPKSHRSPHSQLPPVTMVMENQPYANEGCSQESASGIPDATPNLLSRKAWSSGHDSGFDSMNRDSRHAPILGADAHHYSHSGTCYEVSLTKDPTLGLGITGGIDGENSIKPGDTGFHVYKVIDGLPAQKCAKIAVGDKLLQVDGVEVTSLTSQEVLSLLTGPEKTVSLLLYREPSITLL